MAINSNSANFNNNINELSKFPKYLSTTRPILVEKSEKLEFFEDLLQTIMKICKELQEEDRLHYFESPYVVMRSRRSKISAAPVEITW